MTKTELVNRIAEEAQITKKAAAAALNAFVTSVHDSLKTKDGEIRVSDLGTFKVVARKARTGVDPRTRAEIRIPAMTVPRFSASKALKEAVKKAK
jgi:nucleoid DNA-binding protein